MVVQGAGSAAPTEDADASVEHRALRSLSTEEDRSEPGRRRFSRSRRLSVKERSVLRELARGYTTEEIGAVLHVSPHTVRTHIKNAMRKLEARTRAHAVAIALSEGAIELG